MKVTEECINCGACEEQCETGAIQPADDEHEYTHIDTDKCTECKDCQSVCPVDAIEE